jgi:hypothetical protein
MNAEATSVRAARRAGAALPGSWSAPPSDVAVRAATRLMLLPLRMLATSLGRRLAAATVLSVVLLAMVSSLYDHADGPANASTRALRATPAAAARPAPASRGAAGADMTGTARSPAARLAAERPQDAATAWYARRKRVSVDRVRALQQQRVSATVTRVLVIAEVTPSEMPTAFVTVRRDDAGWKVP